MAIRPVKRLVKAKPTLEGAGVRLRRAFGFGATADSTRSCSSTTSATSGPRTTCAGFPWHPHRGIETITYVLAGTVEHGDSMGNRGGIGAGDIQWMTAGRGIIHQEMPKGDADGRMHGFQLWANLPASLKMTAPRYQEVKAADVPVDADDDGTEVRDRLRAASAGSAGPVDGIAAEPVYLDVSRPAGQAEDPAGRDDAATRSRTCSPGPGKFCNASGPLAVPTEAAGWADTTPPAEADNRSLVLFDRGDEVDGPGRRRRASASCSSRASRSRSRWPGTARS